MEIRDLIAPLLFLALGVVDLSEGQTHGDVMALFKDKLSGNTYNPDVRPKRNQSEAVMVFVTFEVLSIVQVDEVSQSFVCNGVMGIGWIDEILTWDPADYGGHYVIHPKPKDLWKPRMVLINTLGARDLFGDDYAPVVVYANGESLWIPGSLFPISCQLDMSRYPFDQQICAIQLMSMSYSVNEVQYNPLNETVQKTGYTPNGEWELIDSKVETFNLTGVGDGHLDPISVIEISFIIKRNPTFLLINILLPVVFLSALNLLVFIIPVESGEKISYGITVLLALSVFLSIVSGMLPRSSQSFPRVTIYLFSLLIISLLTVIDSIIIVFLHHKEEKVEKHLKAKEYYRDAVNKVSLLRRAVNSTKEKRAIGPEMNRKSQTWSTNAQHNSTGDNSSSGGAHLVQDDEDEPAPNKYKLIGKNIDTVSFVVFTLLWCSVTAGFMIDITS